MRSHHRPPSLGQPAAVDWIDTGDKKSDEKTSMSLSFPK